jgi:hypothetical protein
MVRELVVGCLDDDTAVENGDRSTYLMSLLR